MNRIHRQPALKDPPGVRITAPPRATRVAAVQKALRPSGTTHSARERELALGGLMLSTLTFCWGLLLGGGVVGALVAIF